MITLPRPTREVVHQPTREVVPRQLARNVGTCRPGGVGRVLERPTEGSTPSSGNCEGPSTGAGHRGGPSRSSAEARQCGRSEGDGLPGIAWWSTGVPGRSQVSEPKLQDKPFQIAKTAVWEAYARVKANKGAAGVDEQSIAAFEADRDQNLYKIWNRMSSGSYFPPPVKAVIPKAGGKGVRVLGVPTVADRIAQTVVKMYLEPKVEPIFHPDSYGYRPGKSALDAVGACRVRCWRADWVIDLDIRAFFDTVPWDLVLKAVAHHTDQAWILLYVERWLKAPLQRQDGTLVVRDRGTPQGSAISPLLAKLFMHYAFDAWMVRELPGITFERYCDDAVVHCRSERQARQVRDAIAARLAQIGLELHPDKTRIVYCKDADRPGSLEREKFTFLRYQFRPRLAKNKHGKHFVSFLPAVSTEAMKEMGREIRSWHMAKRSDKSLSDLARMFNSVVQGGSITTDASSRLLYFLRRLNNHLVRWATRKYHKRLRNKERRAMAWLAEIARRSLRLLRTGGWAHVLTVGRWEPDESRGSRPVCAVRRFVVSPAQLGGTRRNVPGSPGLPRRETARGQEHAREAVAVWRRPGRGAARPARYGQGWIA
jgi:RNA-directed DNA polymerase